MAKLTKSTSVNKKRNLKESGINHSNLSFEAQLKGLIKIIYNK